jgi:hypothetical protein
MSSVARKTVVSRQHRFFCKAARICLFFVVLQIVLAPGAATSRTKELLGHSTVLVTMRYLH